MEYIHFPSKLTKEEKMLKSKYSILKIQKKIVNSLKFDQQEIEKPTVITKCPVDAKDATKKAVELVKSGALPILTKKATSSQKTIFKRSMALERKLYAAKFGGDSNDACCFQTCHDNLEPKSAPNFKRKTLYNPSVSVHEEKVAKKFKEQDCKKLKTVLVQGHNISEDFLRKSFQTCGRIVDIVIGKKDCGFVTFNKVEEANSAVQEINGSMVSGIQLKVSLSKKPSQRRPTDHEVKADWCSIISTEDNLSNEEKRNILDYESNIFE